MTFELTEKILILALPLIFLFSFISRNLIVKARTGQRIRAADPILAAAVILTNLCIFTTILSTYSPRLYRFLGGMAFLRSGWMAGAGLVLLLLGIVLGAVISAQMKDSWRFGVHEDQQTPLIRSGIYRFVRNPYYISYFTMFLGLFLVRPGLVLLGFIIAVIAVFHRMVLKEEAFLLSRHGNEYKHYMESTGRYFPLIPHKRP